MDWYSKAISEEKERLTSRWALTGTVAQLVIISSLEMGLLYGGVFEFQGTTAELNVQIFGRKLFYLVL